MGAISKLFFFGAAIVLAPRPASALNLSQMGQLSGIIAPYTQGPGNNPENDQQQTQAAGGTQAGQASGNQATDPTQVSQAGGNGPATGEQQGAQQQGGGQPPRQPTGFAQSPPGPDNAASGPLPAKEDLFSAPQPSTEISDRMRPLIDESGGRLSISSEAPIEAKHTEVERSPESVLPSTPPSPQEVSTFIPASVPASAETQDVSKITRALQSLPLLERASEAREQLAVANEYFRAKSQTFSPSARTSIATALMQAEAALEERESPDRVVGPSRPNPFEKELDDLASKISVEQVAPSKNEPALAGMLAVADTPSAANPIMRRLLEKFLRLISAPSRAIARMSDKPKSRVKEASRGAREAFRLPTVVAGFFQAAQDQEDETSEPADWLPLLSLVALGGLVFFFLVRRRKQRR